MGTAIVRQAAGEVENNSHSSPFVCLFRNLMPGKPYVICRLSEAEWLFIYYQAFGEMYEISI
jgi:hypothetical protein